MLGAAQRCGGDDGGGLGGRCWGASWPRRRGSMRGDPGRRRGGCQRTGPRCAAPQCPPSVPLNGLCLLPPPPPGSGRGLSPLRRWWSRCERIGVQSGCGPPWPRAPGGARPPPPAQPCPRAAPSPMASSAIRWGVRGGGTRCGRRMLRGCSLRHFQRRRRGGGYGIGGMQGVCSAGGKVSANRGA